MKKRMYVIQVLGTANELWGEIPLFLVDANVDAKGGLGSFHVSNDELAARWFDTPALAMAYWQQQSKVKPWREDGKPNKPLTALSVSLERIEVDG